MHIVIDARGRQSSSGRYIGRLIEHLQAIDIDNRYTILLKPGDPWQPVASNFKVKPCPYKQFSFNPLDQITFAIFLKRLKPDLVHFWMTPQEPLFYSGKRITTTHDLTMLRFARAGRLPGWLHALRMAGYRYLLRQSLKKADKIIAISKFTEKEIHHYEQNTNLKTVVIYESSEPQLADNAVAIKAVTEPFIMYVGTAFPHKNLEKLVEAFELLHASDPKLRLVLAGKKEHYYQQLEAKTLLSPASSNIIFTGFVKDSELKWLYEHASAYVFPSLSEGFGLPGLEAFAHSCPVISSNATCLPEIYKDAALYFDPNDATDIADKIKAVLEHPTLANELRAKGQELLKQYSWRKMAEETLAVYKSV